MQCAHARAGFGDGAINRWIGQLFDPLNRVATITALIDTDDASGRQHGRVRELQGRVAAAEDAMERPRRALDTRWDPAELREQYNLAPRDAGLGRHELGGIIDGLGDMAQALDQAEPEDLAELYAALRLSLVYHHVEQIVDVEVDPLADRVDEYRVRGGHAP
jgi:hypothetical protein